MKVISGAHSPDDGSMHLDGQPYKPHHPMDARKAGIAMIYQELNLIPDLDAIENIMLGIEPNSFGFIHSDARRQAALNALAKLHYSGMPLDRPVSSLTIAQKQIIEIARALIHDPKVLILDEPTSSLTRIDTEKLFEALQKLKSTGVSIIYISHFLEECQELCDGFTVLRDGATVDSGAMHERSLQQIMTAMVGRDIKDIYPTPPDSIGDPIISVSQIKGVKKPSDVSFTLRKGEILGLAGLVGAGRTETARAIFGLDSMTSGSVTIKGKEHSKMNPIRSLKMGIGLVSEDRKDEGLLLEQSLADNITMTRFAPVATAGLISSSRQNNTTKAWMEKLKVKARHPQQLISELSGGNQQKIAIGRILYHGADILLMDEPTRGIDVGSKAHIYQLIGELASQGKAVLFISSYIPELLGVCHTIAVMNRGSISDVRPATDWDEHELIASAIQAPNSPADLT